MDGFVQINIKRYNELLKHEATLAALEAAGVDNWEGYEYAMKILKEEDDE